MIKQYNGSTATSFEMILFGFVVHKAIILSSKHKDLNAKVLLSDVMIRESIVYFAM